MKRISLALGQLRELRDVEFLKQAEAEELGRPGDLPAFSNGPLQRFELVGSLETSESVRLLRGGDPG